MAQLDREKIAKKAPWVDAVFGTKNIGSLPQLLDQARIEGHAQVKVQEELTTSQANCQLTVRRRCRARWPSP